MEAERLEGLVGGGAWGVQATHKKNHKKNKKPSYTENASYQSIYSKTL